MKQAAKQLDGSEANWSDQGLRLVYSYSRAAMMRLIRSSLRFQCFTLLALRVPSSRARRFYSHSLE
jgi:hypothetical protein